MYTCSLYSVYVVIAVVSRMATTTIIQNIIFYTCFFFLFLHNITYYLSFEPTHSWIKKKKKFINGDTAVRYIIYSTRAGSRSFKELFRFLRKMILPAILYIIVYDIYATRRRRRSDGWRAKREDFRLH